MKQFKSIEEIKKDLEEKKNKLSELSTNTATKPAVIEKLSKEIEDLEKDLVESQKKADQDLSKKVEKEAVGIAARTRAALEKQKKISLTLELREGDMKEERVILNDVLYVIPRGVTVEVPEEINKILMEKMQADAKVLARIAAMQSKMVEAKLL
jgi:DNA repair exonuclease SbcCD ATPase subunit